MTEACCSHRPSSTKGLSSYAVRQVDPTRTISLRNAFVRDLNRRFTQLRGVIRRTIVDDDALALQGELRTLAEMTSAGRRAFDFPRTGDKVAAFMSWLDKQEAAGILEVTGRPQLGEAVEQAWTNKYIESSYQRGISRARQEMKAKGYPVPSIAESGGIGVAFNTPLHLDRVGLLYKRTFSDLRGITDAMDAQISRVLSQAMAEGKSPRVIARLLTRTISGPVGDLGLTDTLGRFIPAQRRAKILARTEMIRSHHTAMINEYKAWAVEGVTVKAEWVTAGDARVCEECLSMEEREFTLREIEGLIPLHPQCRCIAIPVDVETKGNA